MLWCCNILIPALILSPRPKPSWNPFKTNQPLDSSFPTPAPLVCFRTTQWNSLAPTLPDPTPDPNKGLKAHELSLPTYSVRIQILAVPIGSGTACSDLLSGTCKQSRLLPFKPWSLHRLWPHQLYYTLSRVCTPPTKAMCENSVRSPPHGPSVGYGPSVTQFLNSHVLLPEKVSAHSNLLFHPAESLRTAGTNVPEKYPAHTNAGLKSILTGELEKISFYLHKNNSYLWLRLDREPKAKGSLPRETGF